MTSLGGNILGEERDGKVSVKQVYAPRFFVSSQQRFGVTDIKVLRASQLLGLGKTMIALRQISVTVLFYLVDSKRIYPRRREWRSAPVHGVGGVVVEREKERKRVHMHGREREKG